MVRKIVGHDRLVSALAYQQLGELYQALRLLVNYFQPSMKCQSKQDEEEQMRRVYDEAKTPLQRVLLSGILSEQRTQELQEAAEHLDPLKLAWHLEDLQRALWRCAGDAPGASLVRFSLDVCSSASVSVVKSAADGTSLPQPSAEHAEARDWSHSMSDPFLGEWEQIHVFVLAHPTLPERQGEWSSTKPRTTEEEGSPDLLTQVHSDDPQPCSDKARDQELVTVQLPHDPFT